LGKTTIATKLLNSKRVILNSRDNDGLICEVYLANPYNENIKKCLDDEILENEYKQVAFTKKIYTKAGSWKILVLSDYRLINK